jgi:hypothetical protein
VQRTLEVRPTKRTQLCYCCIKLFKHNFQFGRPATYGEQ